MRNGAWFWILSVGDCVGIIGVMDKPIKKKRGYTRLLVKGAVVCLQIWGDYVFVDLWASPSVEDGVAACEQGEAFRVPQKAV